MTVAELIEELKSLNPELRVVVNDIEGLKTVELTSVAVAYDFMRGSNSVFLEGEDP